MRKLLFLVCTLLLAGCGGLAGEPRIVASLPPATAAPTEVNHPTTPPDIALGAQVFAANCVRCHGTDGKGHGELVQSGQIPPPLDFTAATTSDNDRPDTWFDTITNGNIEHFMPPWHDALTADQRWAVAMYAYTLPDTQEMIAHGRDLFTSNCVECHGEKGKGDGPRSAKIATIPADLTDLSEMASLSRENVFKIVSDGTGTDMPEFGDKLSEADRHDVVAYVRTLALANPNAIGTTVDAAVAQTVEPPAATPEVTEAVSPTTVTVNGTITNGTATGTVPTDLKVTLFSFDANLNQKQTNADANADGSFSFADVPYDPSSTYVITTAYRDRVFNSALLSGDALQADAADGTLTMPLTIYELTEDPDVIQIAGLVTQVTVVTSGLEVAQVFNFTNTSDRAFTSSKIASNGQAISLAITLPPGAVVAGFSDNQNRYVVDQNNFTVYDTVQVVPNEQHVIQMVYLIPYDNDAIIEQPMNYALQGPVRLLMNPATVTVTSDQLPSIGVQTVGSTQYAGYGAELSLAAGDVLRYEVSGAGLTSGQQADQTAGAVSSSNLLLIILGVVIIAVLLVGGLFLLGSRNRSGDQQVINIMVRQIAELDADHDAGKIADDAYEQQRSALKARLAALMERKK